MKRSSILAHRGLFENEQEKNSATALERALNKGFGIETDLRDLNGKTVIAHDPPKENPLPPSLEWLLGAVNSSKYSGRIALNIKSDGLSSLIETLLQSSTIDSSRVFAFDMSVPDTLSYLKSTIPFYSRVSEHEPAPVFQEEAEGVWIDSFDGSCQQVELAKDFIARGMRVTIVSSELHKRDHKSLWNEILESKICFSPLFEICTDYPMEADKTFTHQNQ